jgi:hypothetical protein
MYLKTSDVMRDGGAARLTEEYSAGLVALQPLMTPETEAQLLEAAVDNVCKLASNTSARTPLLECVSRIPSHHEPIFDTIPPREKHSASVLGGVSRCEILGFYWERQLPGYEYSRLVFHRDFQFQFLNQIESYRWVYSLSRSSSSSATSPPLDAILRNACAGWCLRS